LTRRANSPLVAAADTADSQAVPGDGAPPRVLHLEDSDLDAAFIHDRLLKAGLVLAITRVSDRRGFLEELGGRPFDVILSDFQIPSMEGLDALDLAQEHQPDVPFIFVSGIMGEELAVEALQRGATDYVLKQRIGRLPSAFQRALGEARQRQERASVEAALRASEGWLRFALESAHMGTWSLDLRTGVLTSSATCRSLYGRSSEEPFTYEDLAASVLDEDRERWRQVVDAASARGENFEIEYRVRWPDGTVHWVFVRGSCEVDPTGRIAVMSGVSLQIDDRKRAEAATLEAHDQLKSALRTARLCAWDWDPVRDRITASETAGEVFGLAEGQVLDSTRFGMGLIHPEDRERHTDFVRRAASRGESWHTEFRIVRPRDGRTAWLEERATARRDPDTGQVRLTGLTWDVTERKEIEAERGRLTETLRLALDAGELGTWDWDPQTDRMRLSSRAAEIYGIDTRQDYGREQLRVLLHPDDRDRARDEARRAAQERVDYSIEYRLSPAVHGVVRWVTAHGRGVYDPSGALLRMIGVVQDITARKEAEASLRESEARHRILARLADETQPLADPDEVMATSARLLAEHLRVDRCAYAEVEDESVFVITGDHSIGVHSIVGRWPVGAFGSECVRRMRASEPYVVSDTETHPSIGPDERPAYAATNIRAVICVPLHKEGRFTAAMAVHQTTPRVWKPDEIRLVTTFVSRCWEALERSRAAQAERRLHAEVHAERARLEEVFRLAPSFMAVLRGPEHVFERANDRYRDLVGGRPLIGRTIREALPEVASQGFFEILDRVYRSGEPYTGADARVLLKNAVSGELEEHILEFVYQPMWDVLGGVSGVLVQGIELTQRWRAEANLVRVTAESQRQQRLYETVLATTPDLVYVFNLDYQFTYANAALLRMWGKTWDEAQGKTCLELGYEPWHAEMHNREIDQVRETRRAIRGEVPFTGTEGRRVYDYIFVPVLGANGEVEAVAGTTRDVTDRKRMEQELLETDRKKDDFIALLAHELRNPLAPIRNGVQVLRLTPDRDGQSESLEIMDRQLTHMVRIVDDLLDVSRIGRDKMELRLKRMTLEEVIVSAVETARPLIDAAGHELTVSLPPEPIPLEADLTRLAQVFSNLLSNSAKYTPPGGRIAVTTERTVGEVTVCVEDNGIGIPPDSLATIFDMFSQVDRTVERHTGGLGIGLALVKALVEMHDGTVTAESDGRGSRFCVRLPIAADAEGAEEKGIFLASHDGGPQRILVVDDNRDGAHSMAAMLRMLGNQVELAFDGLDAVAKAEAFRPDVILMDIGMPRLNGMDATRRIREQAWGRRMRVIALTGWGQESDRERSRSAGCDGHLVKPVSLDDLRLLLHRSAPMD